MIEQSAERLKYAAELADVSWILLLAFGETAEMIITTFNQTFQSICVRVGENVSGKEFFEVRFAGYFPKASLLDFVSKFGGFTGAGAILKIADKEIVGGGVFWKRLTVEHHCNTFFIKIEQLAGSDEFVGESFLIEPVGMLDFVVRPLAKLHVEAVLVESVFQSLSFVVGDFELDVKFDCAGFVRVGFEGDFGLGKGEGGILDLSSKLGSVAALPSLYAWI